MEKDARDRRAEGNATRIAQGRRGGLRSSNQKERPGLKHNDNPVNEEKKKVSQTFSEPK